MQKLNINELIEFKDEKFNPKVLVNEPGTRIVLLCLRAGQVVPEHRRRAASPCRRLPVTPPSTTAASRARCSPERSSACQPTARTASRRIKIQPCS